MIRRLVRQHGSWVLTIPREVIRLWERPVAAERPILIIRVHERVPRHVEIDIRLPDPSPKGAA